MNPSAAEFQPAVTTNRGGKSEARSPEEEEHEVVNFLKLTFPSFSTRALREFYHSHGNIEETVDAIFKIEAEVQGARLASAPPPLRKQSESMPAASTLTEEEFPSLGSGQKGSQTSYGTLRAPFGGDFASKVKSMPSQQQQVILQQQHERMQSSKASSHLQEPRPIWMSEKGVVKFDTGQAVAEAYADKRAEARDYARIRNSCFEEATKAYLSGDKRLAKELGRKGRMYNAMMKESHEKAAMGIFTSRNEQGGDGSDPVIDLHGLHVSEAQRLLARALDDYRLRRVPQVDVVVGEGKHSKGGPAGKLRMAVMRYLDDAGFRYKEEFSGMIRVYL